MKKTYYKYVKKGAHGAERTFFDILDKLEDRLDVLGEITCKECWALCDEYSYSTFSRVFGDIMFTMIALKKAKRIGYCQYKILKPNTPSYVHINQNASQYLMK